GTSLGSPAPATTQPRRCSRRPVRWRHRPLARVRPCRPGSRCGAGHGGTRRSRRSTGGWSSPRPTSTFSVPAPSLLLAFHPRPAFRQDEQSDRCQQQPGDDRPGPGERDPRFAGPEPDADARAEERRPEPVGAARPSGLDDLPLAELGQLPVDVVEERFTHQKYWDSPERPHTDATINSRDTIALVGRVAVAALQVFVPAFAMTAHSFSFGISGPSAPTLPRRGRYSAPLAGTGGTGRPDLACSRWEVEPDRAILEEERGPAPASAPASVCVSREAMS